MIGTNMPLNNDVKSGEDLEIFIRGGSGVAEVSDWVASCRPI